MELTVAKRLYHHGNLRGALLRSAVKVLNETGVESLSLRELARDLGVSHAAPMRHFASKADLLCALAEEGVDLLIDRMRGAATAQSGRERLRQIANAYIDWACSHAAYHRILRNPDVVRYAQDSLSEKIEKSAELQRVEIRCAQSEGWRANADSEVLLQHLISLTAGLAIVATDPVYQRALGGLTSSDHLANTLDLFFGPEGEAKRDAVPFSYAFSEHS